MSTHRALQLAIDSRSLGDSKQIEMEHHYDIEHDHCGWVAPGQYEPTEDFDYDEVSERLGEIEALPPDASEQAAVVLSRIMAWVWSDGSLRSALVKFSALCMGLRPDLVNRTYQQVGDECGGLTKQNISKATLRAQKLLGVKFTRTRPDSSREVMRAVRLRNPVPRNLRKEAA